MYYFSMVIITNVLERKKGDNPSLKKKKIPYSSFDNGLFLYLRKAQGYDKGAFYHMMTNFSSSKRLSVD